MHAVADMVVSALLCVSAVAGTSGSAAGKSETKASDQRRQVYYDGKLVEMEFAPGRGRLVIGAAAVKAQVSHDKPKDPHPNFYIVAPGTQYSEPGQEEFAHNELVSVMPTTDKAIDWDVYFAIVLDPALHEDFHSERELILATQQDFEPAPEFQFEDIPGAAYLRTSLKIGSLDDLASFRRSDSRLPRVIIVPGKVTVKASVIDPEKPQESQLVSNEIQKAAATRTTRTLVDSPQFGIHFNQRFASSSDKRRALSARL